MPLLQTLEIYEVVTTQAVDIERAGLKRKVRDVANGARSLATRMRRGNECAGHAESEQWREGGAARSSGSVPGEFAD